MVQWKRPIFMLYNCKIKSRKKDFNINLRFEKLQKIKIPIVFQRF